MTLSDGSHPPVVTTATVSGGVWTATAADISGLTNGNITIHADVTDLAGNPAPEASKTVVLDNLAPTIAIDATLAGDNRVNAAEDNTFVVSGTTVGVENGQTVTVTLSDGSHPPVVTTATVSGGVWTATAADISGLTNGNITIHADVTDLAGNPAPEASKTVVLDNLAPTVTVSSNHTSLTAGQTATITFDFSEGVTGFDASDVSVTGGTLGTITQSLIDPTIYTAVFTPTPNVNTTASITVTAGSYTDVAGNTGATGSVSIIEKTFPGEPDLVTAFKGLIGDHPVEGTPVLARVWDDGADVTSTATYQWQVLTPGTDPSNPSNWTTVGGTGSSFTPTDAQEGKQLRVIISYVEGGSVGTDIVTRYLGTVAEPVPTLAVTTSFTDSKTGTQTGVNFALVATSSNTSLPIQISTDPFTQDAGAALSSIIISGVPTDIALYDGSTKLTGASGTYTLTPSQIANLSLDTSKANSLGETFTLSFTAVYTEAGELINTQSQTQLLTIDVSQHVVPWKTAADGNFAASASWTGAGSTGPASGDDALVNISGTYTVTINSSDVAKSLTINNSGTTVQDIAGGALNLGTGALAIDAGIFKLAGGTLMAGSIFIASGGTFLTNGSYSLAETILNNGTIEVFGGTLDITGAITGTGKFVVDGGATLQLATASSAAVYFPTAGGTYGTLVIDHATDYTGLIYNFSGTTASSSDVIDLKDIDFGSGNITFSYYDNSGSDTGGTLDIFATTGGLTTIVDTIRFATGNFTTANFKLSSDGHGGTLIADPPTSATTLGAEPTSSSENGANISLTSGTDTVTLGNGASHVSGTDETANNGDILTGGAANNTLSINTQGPDHTYVFGDGASSHSDIGLTNFEKIVLTNTNTGTDKEQTVTVVFDSNFLNGGTLTVDGSALHNLSGTNLNIDAHLATHDSMIVIGSANSDILEGGSHNDIFTGGAGADTFKFAEMGSAGADTVTDYNYSEGDHIDLSGLLDATAINDSNMCGYIHLLESGSNIVVQVDTAGNGEFSGGTHDVVALVGINPVGADPVRIFFGGHDHLLTA